MSSYDTQSQSQSQSQSPSTEQSTDTRTQSTESTATQGNQAEVEQAGLEGGGTDDYSLSGPFANLLLDVMPVEEAIAVARTVIENPVVQDWLRSLPEAAILDVLRGARTLVGWLMDGVLPVGAGLELAAALGVRANIGVALAQTYTVQRTELERLKLSSNPCIKVGVSEGVGGKVLDAFGHGVDVSAKGEAYVGIEGHMAEEVDLSLAVLLKYAGVSAVELLISRALGLTTPGQLSPVSLPDLVGELDGVDTEASARVSAGAGLSATASVDGISDLPEKLGLAVEPLLGDDLYVEAAALAQLAGLVEGSLTIKDDQTAAFALKGSLKAVAEASGQLGAVFSPTHQASLAAMAELGAAFQLDGVWEVDPKQLQTGTSDLLSTRITLSADKMGSAEASTDGALEQESTMSSLVFDSFDAAKQAVTHQANALNVDGEVAHSGTEASRPLSEVLDEVGSLPTAQTTVQIELDAARLAESVSGLADLVGVDELAGEQSTGLVSNDSELILSGVAAVTPDDFERTRDMGIVLPGSVLQATALDRVGDAIQAARGAGTTPAWLSEWAPALRNEFGGETAMSEGRLKGWIGVGVGGDASVKAGASGSLKGSGTVKYLVDQSATEQDILRLLEAM